MMALLTLGNITLYDVYTGKHIEVRSDTEKKGGEKQNITNKKRL